MSRHWTTLLVLLLGTLVLDAQQPRDSLRPRPVGTASIHGAVTSRGSDPQPLRRARVTITGLDLDYAQTAITADDGTFGFDGLPAGSYTVRASKEPFIATNAGARRTGGTGVPVNVSAGQQHRLDIQLPRGGVITGRIQTADGEPAPGVMVTALVNRYVASAGERRLTAAGAAGSLTDDRGVYRIYGLPPGEYLVSVRPTRETIGGLQVLTDAEIRDALAQVSRQVWNARPGIPTPPARPAVTTEPARPTIGLTQVYYPGTPFLERAGVVRLGEGDVRSAVDFDLDYVALANIDGAVSLPLGAERVQITLARATASGTSEMPRYATADSSGRFAFRAVPPGHYDILARVVPGRVLPGAAGAIYAGTAEVTVTGDDIGGLVIPLPPALSIAGRLVFDPPIEALPALPAAPWIPLVATNVAGANAPPNIAISGDSFLVGGIVPARYRFATLPRGIRTPVGRWWLRSATVSGREILDEPLELKTSATDAILSWSDRASEVSGSARHPNGAPAQGLYAIVFSRQERSWFFNSRRVAATRLPADGRFSIRNLPPGEYLAVATMDVEPDEWFDAEVLRVLARTATPFTIIGDERRTVDLVAGPR